MGKYSECRLFELFISILDVIIQNARTEGNLDSGIVDIKANIIELQGKPKVRHLSFVTITLEFICANFLFQTVHVDQMSGAPTVLFTFTLDRGVTWEVIAFKHIDVDSVCLTTFDI